MPGVLTTETAEITTAAVEIKTLTIRGKQVTLAVFRQLEEKPLLLDNGTLTGVPWGRVNYHPDKCGGYDETGHMHVVWQEGDELRRSRVTATPSFGHFYCAEGTAYASIRYAELRIGVANEYWAGIVDSWRYYEQRSYGAATFAVSEYPDLHTIVNIEKAAVTLPTLPARSSYESWEDQLSELLALDPDEYEAERQAKEREAASAAATGTFGVYAPRPLNERIDEARRRCAQAVADAHRAALAVHDYLFAPGRPSAEQVRQSLVAAVAAEDARRKRVTSVTATLSQLPQLFIAV